MSSFQLILAISVLIVLNNCYLAEDWNVGTSLVTENPFLITIWSVIHFNSSGFPNIWNAHSFDEFPFLELHYALLAGVWCPRQEAGDGHAAVRPGIHSGLGPGIDQNKVHFPFIYIFKKGGEKMVPESSQKDLFFTIYFHSYIERVFFYFAWNI